MTRPDLRFSASGVAPAGYSTRADLLLLFAIILFGIAVRPGPMSAWVVIPATIALGLSIWLDKREARYADDGGWLDTRLLVGVLIFGILGVVGWAPSILGPSSAVLERTPGLAWIAFALVLFVMRRRLTRIILAGVVAATLGLVAILGIGHIDAIGDQGIDVYVLHVRTAQALASGQNPYTDAVTVPDGSPLAGPDDVLTGYVYPPLTGLSYALGHWLAPDTRYTSLAAWLGVLGIVGVAAVRRLSLRHALIMLLLASVPGWWFLLRAAWTEPLSVMFMAIALALWKRPFGSGLGLGAALASKQYFFVTAPVLLLHRDIGWVRRLVVAAAVVAVTIGAVLIWDFSAFWEAAIAFHTSTPPRPDSANLVGMLDMLGIRWAPPSILPIGLGIGAGIWAGAGSHRASTFVLAMAFAMAASFLVSSQAFANYWFLIFGLSAMALMARADEPTRRSP